MSGFAKIFGSILDSSIWDEPAHTRLVWVTMLAMADGNGHVAAAVPGLARRARVTVEQCVDALATLSSPDRYDRSGVDEGRRIRSVQGGWDIINHRHYREAQSPGARRVAEHRRRKRQEGQSLQCNDVTVGNDPLPLSYSSPEEGGAGGGPLAEGTSPGQELPIEAIDLARYLAAEVAKRDAKAKAATATERTVAAWADPIDRLHRIDGRSWPHIQRVLEWSQRHSFWRKNIASGEKLRKQFETLVQQSGIRDREEPVRADNGAMSMADFEVWMDKNRKGAL